MRLTKQQVTDGLAGPGGVRIRFPRPGEAEEAVGLLKAATDDLEPGYATAIDQGQCGAWLLDGLAGADLLEPLVRAAAGGRLGEAAAALSLPLVAQDQDGALVGALLAVPSGTVLSTVSRLPGYQQHALLSTLQYAKIKAVAVRQDARGRGIGGALLQRCVEAYWQLDFQLLFGEFETGRDLGAYYTRHGFTVLQPGDTIDVGTLLTGVPIHLGAGPGETFFYRWRTR